VSYTEQAENSSGSKACRQGGKILFLLGLLLVLIFPFFFWYGPEYHSPRSYKAVWNLGHILFFTIATVFACNLAWRRAMPVDQKFVLVLFAAGVIVGILIEIVQRGIGGRSVDCWDVYRDILGICVGIFSCQAIALSFPLQRFFGIMLVVLLFFSAIPLVTALIDEGLAARQFPILADFETPFEATRFMPADRTGRSGKYARTGRHSLRVQLTTADYSGVSLFYFPHDWRGFQTLHFSVYNPARETIILHCRIHDKRHKQYGSLFADRFNRKLLLRAGWNDFQVSLASVRQAPSNRIMDMSAIESFMLFVAREPHSRVLYLDHIFLSR